MGAGIDISEQKDIQDKLKEAKKRRLEEFLKKEKTEAELAVKKGTC